MPGALDDMNTALSAAMPGSAPNVFGVSAKDLLSVSVAVSRILAVAELDGGCFALVQRASEPDMTGATAKHTRWMT